MLTINIQDDGKTSNLSKTRGHQTQEEIRIAMHEGTQPDYKNAGLAILKLKSFETKFSHNGACPFHLPEY